MNKRFLGDLPDLWPGQYSRRKRSTRRGNSHKKTYPPVYQFVDYPAVRKRLVIALMNHEVRLKSQAALTRISKEDGEYDKKWTNDPGNPFQVGWFKSNLPHVIEQQRGQFNFNELSDQEYESWCKIVKELTGLNVAQGSDKALKIFDKKKQQYWEGHPCLYICTPNASRLVDDGDLLCCLLAIYHDGVCGLAKKVVVNELRSMDQYVYECLISYIGQQKQAGLETLLACAEDKGLLGPVGPIDDETHPQITTVAKSKKSRISLKEANVKARKILKKEHNIKARDLAEKIPCSIGLVSKLPVWKAVQEQLKKGRKAKKIRLTNKMLKVAGSGKKDQVINQLVVEQEADKQEDDRQAKLYLSHEKKPLTRD